MTPRRSILKSGVSGVSGIQQIIPSFRTLPEQGNFKLYPGILRGYDGDPRMQEKKLFSSPHDVDRIWGRYCAWGLGWVLVSACPVVCWWSAPWTDGSIWLEARLVCISDGNCQICVGAGAGKPWSVESGKSTLHLHVHETGDIDQSPGMSKSGFGTPMGTTMLQFR
ncbi:hypothetical protein BCR34DRAFT_133577 [Clohesyomyces aquaticus]|uniref:Uncharacterized protein n=1 Tax=Clohesyomyces aquaticus TaxID=1231657 RepID=A0A1Y2ABZ4_9PLEO|nr:hypothetical protein BCR34DRAFT_133577 [Clohesyomyces aquaticus]